jgi:hypothetical protein
MPLSSATHTHTVSHTRTPAAPPPPWRPLSLYIYGARSLNKLFLLIDAFALSASSRSRSLLSVSALYFAARREILKFSRISYLPFTAGPSSALHTL